MRKHFKPLAGEILWKHLKRQQENAKDFGEYMHLQMCIDKCEIGIMWRNKEYFEEEAIVQSEIDNMLLETA